MADRQVKDLAQNSGQATSYLGVREDDQGLFPTSEVLTGEQIKAKLAASLTDGTESKNIAQSADGDIVLTETSELTGDQIKAKLAAVLTDGTGVQNIAQSADGDIVLTKTSASGLHGKALRVEVVEGATLALHAESPNVLVESFITDESLTPPYFPRGTEILKYIPLGDLISSDFTRAKVAAGIQEVTPAKSLTISADGVVGLSEYGSGIVRGFGKAFPSSYENPEELFVLVSALGTQVKGAYTYAHLETLASDNVVNIIEGFSNRHYALGVVQSSSIDASYDPALNYDTAFGQITDPYLTTTTSSLAFDVGQIMYFSLYSESTTSFLQFQGVINYKGSRSSQPSVKLTHFSLTDADREKLKDFSAGLTNGQSIVVYISTESVYSGWKLAFSISDLNAQQIRERFVDGLPIAFAPAKRIVLDASGAVTQADLEVIPAELSPQQIRDKFSAGIQRGKGATNVVIDALGAVKFDDISSLITAAEVKEKFIENLPEAATVTKRIVLDEAGAVAQADVQVIPDELTGTQVKTKLESVLAPVAEATNITRDSNGVIGYSDLPSELTSDEIRAKFKAGLQTVIPMANLVVNQNGTIGYNETPSSEGGSMGKLVAYGTALPDYSIEPDELFLLKVNSGTNVKGFYTYTGKLPSVLNTVTRTSDGITYFVPITSNLDNSYISQKIIITATGANEGESYFEFRPFSSSLPNDPIGVGESCYFAFRLQDGTEFDIELIAESVGTSGRARKVTFVKPANSNAFGTFIRRIAHNTQIYSSMTTPTAYAGYELATAIPETVDEITGAEIREKFATGLPVVSASKLVSVSSTGAVGSSDIPEELTPAQIKIKFAQNIADVNASKNIVISSAGDVGTTALTVPDTGAQIRTKFVTGLPAGVSTRNVGLDSTGAVITDVLPTELTAAGIRAKVAEGISRVTGAVDLVMDANQNVGIADFKDELTNSEVRTQFQTGIPSRIASRNIIVDSAGNVGVADLPAVPVAPPALTDAQIRTQFQTGIPSRIASRNIIVDSAGNVGVSDLPEVTELTSDQVRAKVGESPPDVVAEKVIAINSDGLVGVSDTAPHYVDIEVVSSLPNANSWQGSHLIIDKGLNAIYERVHRDLSDGAGTLGPYGTLFDQIVGHDLPANSISAGDALTVYLDDHEKRSYGNYSLLRATFTVSSITARSSTESDIFGSWDAKSHHFFYLLSGTPRAFKITDYAWDKVLDAESSGGGGGITGDFIKIRGISATLPDPQNYIADDVWVLSAEDSSNPPGMYGIKIKSSESVASEATKEALTFGTYASGLAYTTFHKLLGAGTTAHVGYTGTVSNGSIGVTGILPQEFVLGEVAYFAFYFGDAPDQISVRVSGHVTHVGANDIGVMLVAGSTTSQTFVREIASAIATGKPAALYVGKTEETRVDFNVWENDALFGGGGGGGGGSNGIPLRGIGDTLPTTAGYDLGDLFVLSDKGANSGDYILEDDQPTVPAKYNINRTKNATFSSVFGGAATVRVEDATSSGPHLRIYVNYELGAIQPFSVESDIYLDFFFGSGKVREAISYSATVETASDELVVINDFQPSDAARDTFLAALHAALAKGQPAVVYVRTKPFVGEQLFGVWAQKTSYGIPLRGIGNNLPPVADYDLGDMFTLSADDGQGSDGQHILQEIDVINPADSAIKTSPIRTGFGRILVFNSSEGATSLLVEQSGNRLKFTANYSATETSPFSVDSHIFFNFYFGEGADRIKISFESTVTQNLPDQYAISDHEIYGKGQDFWAQLEAAARGTLKAVVYVRTEKEDFGLVPAWVLRASFGGDFAGIVRTVQTVPPVSTVLAPDQLIFRHDGNLNGSLYGRGGALELAVETPLRPEGPKFDFGGTLGNVFVAAATYDSTFWVLTVNRRRPDGDLIVLRTEYIFDFTASSGGLSQHATRGRPSTTTNHGSDYISIAISQSGVATEPWRALLAEGRVHLVPSHEYIEEVAQFGVPVSQGLTVWNAGAPPFKRLARSSNAPIGLGEAVFNFVNPIPIATTINRVFNFQGGTGASSVDPVYWRVVMPDLMLGSLGIRPLLNSDINRQRAAKRGVAMQVEKNTNRTSLNWSYDTASRNTTVYGGLNLTPWGTATHWVGATVWSTFGSYGFDPQGYSVEALSII